MNKKPKLEEWAGLWIGLEGFGERLGGLVAGKSEVCGYLRRQRRPDKLELASILPLDLCEDRAKRDEGIYGAYIGGRFSQREIADHLGLHYVTIGGIVRAKERERRESGAERGDAKTYLH